MSWSGGLYAARRNAIYAAGNQWKPITGPSRIRFPSNPKEYVNMFSTVGCFPTTSHENLRGPLPIPPPKKALFPCRNVALGGGPRRYSHEQTTHPFQGSASMPRVRRFCVCRFPLVTSQSGHLFLFWDGKMWGMKNKGGAWVFSLGYEIFSLLQRDYNRPLWGSKI